MDSCDHHEVDRADDDVWYHDMVDTRHNLSPPLVVLLTNLGKLADVN